MFHRNIFKIGLLITAKKGKRSCSLPLKNAVAFFHPFLRAPEVWRRVFRRLRTATRATRPGPGKLEPA